ncbi:MAG: hypothetical protein J0L75_02055 [Spirochaetes bacterium]|nr:hypothetical protein [Spirochaetota bacterium]
MKHLTRFSIVMVLLTATALFAEQPRFRNIVTMPWFTFDKGADWRFEASRGVKVTNGTTNVTMRVVAKSPTTMASQSSNSLHIGAAFYARGHNWVDAIPVKEQAPFEGVVQSVDIWAWGGNYDWTLEVRLKDMNDVEYTLPMGSLRYLGWQNLNLDIPTAIPQSTHLVGGIKGLSVLKFRMTSMPSERPERFNCFLNTFKVITDTFKPNYDGAELERMLVEESKGNSSGNK